MGDSAGAATSARDRSRAAPGRCFDMSAYRLSAAGAVRPRWIAMSMATNASPAGRCTHNPARVKGSAVVRNCRMETTSRDGMTHRRTVSPARERSPDDGGTATSTGLVGSRSRPNSQAAVAPTKTVSSGSTRRQAESVSQGSSGSSFQRYSSAPRRCQLVPLSALRVSPALRASSRKKGLRVSSGGIRGALPTAAQCGFRSIRPTHVVKASAIEAVAALHAEAVPAQVVVPARRADQSPRRIRLQPPLVLPSVPDAVLGSEHPAATFAVQHGKVSHREPERARLQAP